MKQMKRHEKLLAAMLLSLVCLLMAIGDVPALAAADNPTDRQANRFTDHADIEELTGALETANTLEQVLARHKSVSVNMKLSFNGKKAFDMDWYITADSFYRAESDGFAYYRSADIYLETVGDNYSEIAMLLTDEAGYQEWLQDAFAGLPGLIEFPETEELVSVQEENGKLLVTSRQADAEYLSAYMDKNYAPLGLCEPYAPGMFMTSVCCFDAESYDVLELHNTLHWPDGSELPFEDISYSYDAESPDLAAPDAPLAAFFNETQELQTVTVVFSSGAPEEHTARFQFPESIVFGFWYDGEVPQEIYEDPEFTQLFEDVNGRTELTLYLAPRAEG